MTSLLVTKAEGSYRSSHREEPMASMQRTGSKETESSTTREVYPVLLEEPTREELLHDETTITASVYAAPLQILADVVS